MSFRIVEEVFDIAWKKVKNLVAMFNQSEGVNEFCTGNVKYASGVSNLKDYKKQISIYVFYNNHYHILYAQLFVKCSLC
jgi:hypothetical protein